MRGDFLPSLIFIIMPFPLGSLISAAGGLLSGGISTLGNLLGANKSFKMQQQLAAQQFDYNKQSMHKKQK